MAAAGEALVNMMDVVMEQVAVAAPVEAMLLKTGPFPLAKDAAARLHGVLQPWMHACAGKDGLKQAIWLQGSSLHTGDTVEMLSSHGAAWAPEIGLAVRPDGEPPRMLKADDFRKRQWTDEVKPKHETVFHLTKDTAVEPAYSLLCGGGTVVYCLLHAPVDVYLKEQRALWLPRITEPAFRAHSFYLPLLRAGTLGGESAATLLEWMGRAKVYLRESVEDQGVLIVTTMSGALRQLEERWKAMLADDAVVHGRLLAR